jgi:hypothetical protein
MALRGRHVEKADYYRGVRMAPYDLVKELAIAMAAVLVIVLVLAAVLSSPDVPSATIRSWATTDPVDFLSTAASELAGASTVANYGPPYNNGTGSVQRIGGFSPQGWIGAHLSVDPAVDFVLQPLTETSTADPQLAAALSTFNAASSEQQQTWLTAYTNALGTATVTGDQISIASGNYGPVTMLMGSLLSLGQSGALDGLLLISNHFYQTDYTLPLLFMDDGGYISQLATNQTLTGSQWGMMNETGRYPGQAWLWLYTLWYQIPPYNTASNADLLVVLTMAVLTLALLLVPFIPGLRDLPRWIPLHRLIWRSYYRTLAAPARANAPPPAPAATTAAPASRGGPA